MSALSRALVSVIARLYHALPIMGGQTRLSRNGVIERLLADVKGPVEARLWDGTRMLVDPHDHDGRILFLFGTNDIKVSRNIRVFLKPGDVFLDIGANHGSVGFYAADAVGPAGAVHLFEPQRRIADRVEAAIAGARYRNVTLHRCGLLDIDTTLQLHVPSDHSGSATFAEAFVSDAFDMHETCPVREIGGYVGPLVAGRPFGAKLDIEGAEPRVMPWLLAQPNLRFLIFEGSRNADALYEMVRGSGLALFGLKRTVLQLRLGRIDRAEDMGLYHDLIVLRLKPGAEPPALVYPPRLLPLLAEIEAGRRA